MIREWVKRLRRRDRERGVRPLERALLRELRSRLDAEAAEILGEQIACIERVWWSQNTLTSVFYYVPMVPGESSPTFRRFPADHERLTLATARIERTGITQVWTVDFEIAGGFIGALKFDPDPAPILDCENPVIREFATNLDPMSTRRKRPPGCEKPFPDVSDLHGWVRECADRFGATNLRWPLGDDALPRTSSDSGIRLPEDYLDIVRQTDGITFGQRVSVFGLNDAYEVEMDDGTYYLLAELAPYDASSFLGVKVGEDNLTVYRLGTAEPPSVPLGLSFRKAIEHC